MTVTATAKRRRRQAKLIKGRKVPPLERRRMILAKMRAKK